MNTDQFNDDKLSFHINNSKNKIKISLYKWNKTCYRRTYVVICLV